MLRARLLRGDVYVLAAFGAAHVLTVQSHQFARWNLVPALRAGSGQIEALGINSIAAHRH